MKMPTFTTLALSLLYLHQGLAEEPEIIIQTSRGAGELRAFVQSDSHGDPGCGYDIAGLMSQPSDFILETPDDTGCLNVARARFLLSATTIAMSEIDLWCPTATELYWRLILVGGADRTSEGSDEFIDNGDGTASLHYVVSGTIAPTSPIERVWNRFRLSTSGSQAAASIDSGGRNIITTVEATPFVATTMLTAEYTDQSDGTRLWTRVSGHWCLTVDGECRLEPDADGDGVPDADDEFPHSITDPTVEYGNVVIENFMIDNGAWLADEIDFALQFADTEEVVTYLVELKAAGLLSGREMGQILRDHNTTP